MGKGIRIGKVFGIELRLDQSWLMLFGLVVWGLTSLFGAWHPLWTTGTAVAVAIVAALAFFASIVAHELSHALVAKLFGVPVHDITLHMFGGVANIQREPPSAGAEFLIAIAGPIASVLLGLVMLALTSLLTGIGAPSNAELAASLARLGPVTTVLLWLGPVNVVLGVFNLLPGFPLDGGRVLRAILWKATGNMRTATRWSTSVGQAVGLGLVSLGLAMALGVHVPFFGTGLGSGLWLAFIGLFLRRTAKQHRIGSDVAEALEGTTVSAVMRTSGGTIPANASILTLAERAFFERDEGPLPVIFGERVIGLVSLEEAMRVPRSEWPAHTVREIMVPVETMPPVAPSELAFEALRKMGAADVTALAVIEDGVLQGVLSQERIAQWVALHTAELHDTHAHHA